MQAADAGQQQAIAAALASLDSVGQLAWPAGSAPRPGA